MSHGRVPKRLARRPDDIPCETLAVEAAPEILSRRLQRVRKHTERIALHLDGKLAVRSVDTHQARVWSRRSAAAIAAFESRFDPAHVRRLKRQLRKVRRACGNVRGMEIHAEIATGILAAREPLACGFVQGVIAKRWAEASGAIAREKAIRDVDRAAGIHARALDSVAERDGDGEASLRATGRAALNDCRELLVPCRDLDANDADDLHGLRLLLKRVRYSLELFGPSFASPAEPALASALTMCQDEFGRSNDLHEFSELLKSQLNGVVGTAPVSRDLAHSLSRSVALLGSMHAAQRVRCSAAWARMGGVIIDLLEAIAEEAWNARLDGVVDRMLLDRDEADEALGATDRDGRDSERGDTGPYRMGIG